MLPESTKLSPTPELLDQGRSRLGAVISGIVLRAQAASEKSLNFRPSSRLRKPGNARNSARNSDR